MSGRRTETVLTSAAYAAIIITIELLRAHRSSLWAPLGMAEWLAVVVAWIVYAVFISAAAVLVRTAATRIGPLRIRLLGTPSIYVPTLSALCISIPLSAHGGSSVLTHTFVFWGFAAIALAQRWWWREYFASTVLVSIAFMVMMAAAIAAMTVFDLKFYAVDNGVGGNYVTFLAFATMAAVGVALLAIHEVYRWWSLRESGFLPMLYAMSAIGLLIVTWANLLPSEETSHEAPSIILVTADTLRADVMSVYGGAVETPNLEFIAEQSATFDRAYALAPWTLPSVFGMMTSQYPPHLSPDGDYKRWSKEISLYRFPDVPETFAERLRDRGYVTGACVANSLLRDREGVLRGFDTVRVIGHRTHTLDGIWRGMPWLQKAMYRMGAPGVVEKPADTTRVCAAFAESFLRMHKGKPVFLWIHFMDPHTAYAPPPKFAPKGVAWPIYCNADPHWGTPLSDANGDVDVTTSQRVDIRALYDAEVRYVDEAVMRVWTATRENNYGAFFVFTSDHGEAFWEHDNYGHGQSLYDHQVRVPLMIAHPIVEARRIETPVSHIDFLPTLSDGVGAERIESWIGKSWWNALMSPSEPLNESPVFSQATNVHTPEGPLVMTMDGMTKAIYNQRTHATHLFHLEDDPGEMRPADAGTDQALTVRIEQHLNTYGSEVADIFARDHALDEGSEELVEQLRAMGYIN